jgi:hypothetical protein
MAVVVVVVVTMPIARTTPKTFFIIKKDWAITVKIMEQTE